MTVAQNGISLNGTNGHSTNGYTLTDPQAWKREQTPGWHNAEPRFVHSVRWTDPEHGIEHLTVVRSDSQEDLRQQVKQIVAMVKTVKAARKEPPLPTAETQAEAAAAQASPAAHCAVHGVMMQRTTKGNRSFYWHKIDGQFCHGKGAKA
jgi:hypothetical protein